MSDDGPGTREVAYRLFAAEFDDATLSYSESDEERAPNYVVTPTGLRVNRLFAVGVLTEVEHINDDTRRGRVVDPTGAFVTYAGQYQPDEQTFLERADPPSFVSITGKARTFEPEDSDRVFTSVRPESLNEVDAETRDRWTVTAAEATLDRLAVFAKALDSDLRGDDLRAALEAGGAPAALAAGIPRALDHYRPSPAYLEAVRQMAVDALEVVAGDRDDVRAPDLAPDEGGTATLGPLPETDVVVDETVVSEPEPSAEVATAAADADEAEDATGMEEASEAATDETAAEAEPATTEGSSTEASPSTETAAEHADDETAATATSDAMSGSTTGGESADAAVETSTTAPADGPESTDVESTESDDLDEFDDELETDTEVDETAEPSGTSTDTADDLGSFDAESETVDESSSTAESVAEPGVESSSETGATMGEDGPVAGGTDGDEDMYELDEEEREEIESEFGTDFSTGTEVEDPGEADIDVPDPEELEELEAEDSDGAGAEADTEPVADEAGEPESAAEPDATDEVEAEAETGDEQAAEDVDLEDAVVDAMTDLDDGDGADREAVVAAVVDEYGADPGAVEDAIQDALMGGQCYEPGEGTLKAI